ncbi:MAG: hypothetical protein ACJ8CR_04990 [Roseiflexaceae bacterium]
MPDDRYVADALGALCDGHDISAEEQQAALAALAGPVETDDGALLYYAQVDTMALTNVDTAEGIWSVPADGLLRLIDGRIFVDFADDEATFQKEFFLLMHLRDPVRFVQIEARWLSDPDSERQAAWQAFVQRVVEPLHRCGAQ